jgi:hypothetical protein
MYTIVSLIDRVYAFVIHTTEYIIRQIAGETIPLEMPKEVGQQAGEIQDLGDDPEEVPITFKKIGTLLRAREEVKSAAVPLAHEVMYVGSGDAPLYLRPVREFDEVVVRVPYGSMVLAMEEEGRFVRVSYARYTGYMLRDDVADRASFVYPEFVPGEENAYDDPNTLRVRACIRDLFGGGETEYPLQAGEYVTYRLFRKGLSISWAESRPRVPGRWHELLEGAPGIAIDTTPKPGAIMESLLGDDVGHVAYVEAVFPDEVITISETNYPDRGVYSERTLSKEAWGVDGTYFIHVGAKSS